MLMNVRRKRTIVMETRSVPTPSAVSRALVTTVTPEMARSAPVCCHLIADIKLYSFKVVL